MKRQEVFVLFLMALGAAQTPLNAQLPTITNQPATRAVWAGASVTFSVGVSGAGPFTYQWLFNGKNLSNGIITSIITTFEPAPSTALNGPAATNAALVSPSSVSVDALGNVFISDSSTYRVYKVSPDDTITSIAGNGIEGYSGDGRDAINASLNRPSVVAVDASGNLFIADSGNNRIREVNTNGIIETVAGNGTNGYAGDGGPATNAPLGVLSDMATDANGNLYIADSSNNVVREINASGTITTVAGNGTNGYSGDGGPAISAELNSPRGIAVDASGNLLIADTGNGRIREVNAKGNITTVAGMGEPGYFGDGGPATNAVLEEPSGIAADPSGNLFITDPGHQRVRKVDTNGIITTLAGNGNAGYSGDGQPGPVAELHGPSAVAADTFGNVFIADSDNNVIRKVGANGFITTFAGGGIGDGIAVNGAQLFNPTDVVVDRSGNLFIADTGNNRICKVSLGGILTTVAGNANRGFSGDGGLATLAALNHPMGVALDASGNLFIADGFVVRKVNTNGIITTVAGGGDNYLGDGGPATNAVLLGPTGVLLDASANLLIADWGTAGRIRKVNANGIITTIAGGGTNFGSLGDGGLATNAILNYPQGMALDTSGDLFIADKSENRIRKVSTDGIITTVAYYSDVQGENPSLGGPSGVALDAGNNLFIADTGNNVIREIDLYGVFTTVVGPWYGAGGQYSGDGGLATQATLNNPRVSPSTPMAICSSRTLATTSSAR